MVFSAILIFTDNVSAVSDDTAQDSLYADRILGDKDAPLTIIEYASLGCSHCGFFHQEILPLIKEEFIDTGMVKLIFRDFPLDSRSMATAMIARCAPQQRYFGMISLFFSSREEWTKAEDALQAITNTARFGGIDKKTVNKCLENQELLDTITERAEEAKSNFGINSTPSFVIGGENGRKIEGVLSIDEFREIIKQALKTGQ